MINRVVILGAGNVAFHLTRALLQSTVNVQQIYNRTMENAQYIAEAHNIPYTDKISELKKADLYIIASSDSAIEEISYHVPFTDVLVVHTSGSMPLSSLKGNYRKGVLYPLQTFTKDKTIEYDEIPFFIETENNEDWGLLQKLAERISPEVHLINSDQRLKMHIAAVFVNNFTNHMYSIAEKICKENHIPYDVMHPLIKETTDKALYLSPKDSQTGPAERADEETIKKHLAHLEEPIKSLYQSISNSISKEKNE